jgi:transposase
MWEKPIAGENENRELLRNFGAKMGAVGVIKFEERIRDLVPVIMLYTSC